MSSELIRAMFKHLVRTYSIDETREILLVKFPESESLVMSLTPEDFDEENRVQEAKATRVVASKKEREAKTAKTTKVKTKKTGKKELAMEIYKNSVDKSRKSMLKLLTDELGVSQSTASNLYHYCKKTSETSEN